MILIETDETWELWHSLGRACRYHGFSYAHLKQKKMPFEHEGAKFSKWMVERFEL